MAEIPIWQKHQVCIWTDKSTFDAVRQMLKKKHGLVQARDSPLTQDLTIRWLEGRKLVYVDHETDLGIYRVDFREKTNQRLARHWPSDLVSLGYWNLNNLSSRIRREDPMKAALTDVYHLLKPQHVTLGFEVGDPVELSDLLGAD